MASSIRPLGDKDSKKKDKPPLATNSASRAKKNDLYLPSTHEGGGLQRSQSLQWRDQKHLEELSAMSQQAVPTLKRAKSLTKLGISKTEETLLKRHLSSSNILALSDTSLSLKEALPVKIFSDKGSTLGEEKVNLTNYAQLYYHQLTKGCGDQKCNSVFCISSPLCPTLNQEMEMNLSVLLAMTKGKYMCSRRMPVRHVFPKIPERANKNGRKDVKFLTKLFSMSSFSSLFHSVEDNDKKDHSKSTVASNALNLSRRNSAQALKKEENPHQLIESVGTDESSMLFGGTHYVCPSTEENGNIYDEPCDTRILQVKNNEMFSLTHLNMKMLESVVNQYNDCGDDNFLKATLRTVFASPEALSTSFLNEDNGFPTEPGIDNLNGIDKSYQILLNVDKSDELFAEINSSTSIMLSSLRLSSPRSAKSLVWPVIIVLKNPKLFELSDVPLRLCRTISELGEHVKNDLVLLISSYSMEGVQFLTLQFQKILSSITEVKTQSYEDVVAVCETLKILYQACLKICGDPLPKKVRFLFYNNNFSKSLDLIQELTDWKKTEDLREISHTSVAEEKFTSYTNSPIGQFSFLLLPETKIQVLHLEAMMQMKDEYQTALVHQVKIQHMHKVARGFNPNELSADVKSAACPYLVLNVSRENIVQGTLELLRKKEKDLKKPLKVVFTGKGEQGLDLGGLQKEFFQIFLQEVINADYELFQRIGSGRHSWFATQTTESSELFKVIGMVIGIAIYNGIILDLHFPPVLYRKLLGIKVSLEDLKDIQPTIANSLSSLLTYDGDIENTFCLTFQITEDLIGKLAEVDLVESGGSIPVTEKNRQLFVDLYVEYLLTKSVSSQFDAFSEGFYKVCGDGAITLFDPYELELLICGSPELDFHALQKVTTYYGGFSPNHYLIKEFWRIVHSLKDEQKHKVLNFVTGSHRVPVGGLGALSFAIQRSGSNTDNLPTAMTCFNRLFLPNYSDESILEEKLILAIENCQGFGLV